MQYCWPPLASSSSLQMILALSFHPTPPTHYIVDNKLLLLPAQMVTSMLAQQETRQHTLACHGVTPIILNFNAKTEQSSGGRQSGLANCFIGDLSDTAKTSSQGPWKCKHFAEMQPGSILEDILKDHWQIYCLKTLLQETSCIAHMHAHTS